MTSKRKFQVFVSSTYADLQEERQAAVEAILTAGHIPAGMELFVAGDETQMAVIRRWIDESDIFLLILGGRYGSIEATTKKSYVHLEYEYAVSKQKPLFSVIISDEYLEKKVKKGGRKMLETDYPQQLKDFRESVRTRMVRFWSDPRDIKLAILETLADFARKEGLVGWIPGTEALNSGVLAEELARLTKENADLRERVNRFSKASKTYGGATFEEMYKLLLSAPIDWSKVKDSKEKRELDEIVAIFGDSGPGLIHVFWVLSEAFSRKAYFDLSDEFNRSTVLSLVDYGLVERDEERSAKLKKNIYGLTADGREFLLRLRLERDLSNAQRLVRSWDVED